MLLNSYLKVLATNAIVRDEEKVKIKTSIEILQSRLNSYFGKSIKDQFVFGSHSRDTILPRFMDGTSDVDYLVVFTDESLEPQTYLNQLRNFAGSKYAASEIYQSNPTIVLSLGHIDFELVPAISSSIFLNYKIPGKSSGFSKWIDTDPKGFNKELTEKNKYHNNLIRELIRLLKYWNAKNGYPFESYELEQQICRHRYSFSLRYNGRLKDYFFEFMNNFDINQLTSNKKLNAVERAQQVLKEVKSLDDNEEKNKISVILGTFQNPKTKTAVDVTGPTHEDFT